MALTERGVQGIEELRVRFDCGFEAGDKLVNKDPTFGKLNVSRSAPRTALRAAATCFDRGAEAHDDHGSTGVAHR